MKVNIVKYIFMLVVIILIGYGIYMIHYKKDPQDANNQATSQETTQNSVNTNLRLGIHQYDTMNPILSQNKNIQFIDKLVFEPLLTINNDYSLSNCLAEECSKTGDNSYIIKLKSNIKFQDGTELKANDVKFTIDQLKSGDVTSIYKDNVSNIYSLDIIDDRTIKITLNEAQPFFEYNLIFPILSSQNFDNENFTTSTKVPVGTGMYQIDKMEGSFISLIKNPNYWDTSKKPKIDTININIYSSMGEVYNAFKIGNIDLIPTSNTNFREYIGTIGFNVSQYKARDFDYLAMNTQNAILSKTEVRKAIASSIDKANIVATVFDDNYDTSDYPLDYGNYLYDSSIQTDSYNPEYAQQLLEEAGWEFKYKQWQKVENYKTLRTSFDLVVNASNVRRVAVAEAIKNQLANVGIQINVKKVSDAQYNSYIENRNYDLILAGTKISATPDLARYFGDSNLANYDREEAKNLLHETYQIADAKTLREKFAELQKIYVEDVPFVSLYINREYLVSSTKLFGEQKPNWYNVFYNMENWYRQN